MSRAETAGRNDADEVVDILNLLLLGIARTARPETRAEIQRFFEKPVKTVSKGDASEISHKSELSMHFEQRLDKNVYTL